MRRSNDVTIYTAVTPDEHVLIKTLADREMLTVSEFVRRAINALALVVGDELVFLEPRKRGRPRKEAA